MDDASEFLADDHRASCSLKIFPNRFRVRACPQSSHYFWCLAHSLFILQGYIVINNSFNCGVDFKLRIFFNMSDVWHITPQQYPAARSFWLLYWVSWNLFASLPSPQFPKSVSSCELMHFQKCLAAAAAFAKDFWSQLLVAVEASRLSQIKLVLRFEKSPCRCVPVVQNSIQQWLSTVFARIVILCLVLCLGWLSKQRPEKVSTCFNNVPFLVSWSRRLSRFPLVPSQISDWEVRRNLFAVHLCFFFLQQRVLTWELKYNRKHFICEIWTLTNCME